MDFLGAALGISTCIPTLSKYIKILVLYKILNLLLSYFCQETQSQRSMASLDQGEQERLINDTVKCLLILDQKKYPVKKAG